ncbi:hypothetical protein AgCh_000849 [Apium graveolens]
MPYSPKGQPTVQMKRDKPLNPSRRPIKGRTEGRIKKEIVPDHSKLAEIFNKLQLCDSTSFNNEIHSLEDEVQNQGDENLKSDMISLIGLARYAKCVLHGASTPRSTSRRRRSMGDLTFPADFRCSISLDLMRDPVVVSMGQTYDHSSINLWLESGHNTCPKTGEKQVYPPPPFPKRVQKQKLDKQFAKFLEVFKKLHINIPFAEALEQMPSYAKFMKGILFRKMNLDDLEIVDLTEECSAVLQQKLPPKLKDPGNFTIPCTIGNLSFDKCLCDLGASINLMPLSVFKKLDLPDPKPTYMSLQLADRSITYPRVIVEDVLVKVDKLIFPADFVILDFKEDKKIPIILGRPFLATGRTLIDVQKGELTMRVLDQDVMFNVFNAMKFPTNNEECLKVELVDSVVTSELHQMLRSDALKKVGEFR